MSYPDEHWLRDFERRLAAGQVLTGREAQVLITALWQAHQERAELVAALAPLSIALESHPQNPRPDEWYYRAAGVAGGPVVGRGAALRAAVRHHCTHYHEIHAEGAALAAEVVRLQARVAELGAQLDQADTGLGLEPWRRVVEE